MNITITLGWWMVPALLPSSFFVYAGYDYLKHRQTRNWLICCAYSFALGICAFLTRYL